MPFRPTNVMPSPPLVVSVNLSQLLLQAAIALLPEQCPVIVKALHYGEQGDESWGQKACCSESFREGFALPLPEEGDDILREGGYGQIAEPRKAMPFVRPRDDGVVRDAASRFNFIALGLEDA